MNKNLIVGVAIAALFLAIGLIFVNKDKIWPVTNTEIVPPPAVPGTPEPAPAPGPSPVPAPAASAPIVQTDSQVVPSNSTAVVTGKVTPNGALTEYWYEYGESTALGTRTAAQAIGSGFIAISAPAYITGLRADTNYYFRLSAKNAFGTVNGSTQNFRTNNSPPVQGVAPTTRTDAASDISRTTANLNGQVNPHNSQTTYWFEYGVSAELGNVTAFQSAGNGNALLTVSASLSNLNPLTKYYFRLNAQNQYGTVTGPILNFTTKGPAAPGVPTVSTEQASDIATSSVTLNGRLNPNGAQTTYWFEYGEDSLLGGLLVTATPSQSLNGSAAVSVSADINDLEKNTKYFYRLMGRNQYGIVRGDIVFFRTNP